MSALCYATVAGARLERKMGWDATRGRNENCLNDTPKTGADYKSHVEEDDTAGQNTDIWHCADWLECTLKDAFCFCFQTSMWLISFWKAALGSYLGRSCSNWGPWMMQRYLSIRRHSCLSSHCMCASTAPGGLVPWYITCDMCNERQAMSLDDHKCLCVPVVKTRSVTLSWNGISKQLLL